MLSLVVRFAQGVRALILSQGNLVLSVGMGLLRGVNCVMMGIKEVVNQIVLGFYKMLRKIRLRLQVRLQLLEGLELRFRRFSLFRGLFDHLDRLEIRCLFLQMRSN